MIEIKATEDGLHLEGTILWFDSYRTDQLSFLSSAKITSRCLGPKFLATNETLKLLEAFHRKPQALVCQYNRPFSIGKLKMELLPSGAMLGGAVLLVEKDGERILYAPAIQTQKLSTVRPLEVCQADSLILSADRPYLLDQMPHRKKEKERFLQSIRNHVGRGIYPIVLCEVFATAQELTKWLSDEGIGVAVHSSIHRIHKIYDSFSCHLGEYSLFSDKSKKNKVLLFPPLCSSRGPRGPMPEGPVLIVEDAMEERHSIDFCGESPERFFINSTSHGRELKDIIAKIAPKKIYIYGTYAKQYIAELKHTAPLVAPLYPNDQPTLF